MNQCVLCGSYESRVVFTEFGVDIVKCSICGHIYSKHDANQDNSMYFGSDDIAPVNHAYWNEAHRSMYEDFSKLYLQNHLTLYDKIIDKIKGSFDDYSRNDGMTPLMILAESYEIYSLLINEKKHVIKKLMEKSDILKYNIIEYEKTKKEYNAITYAFIHMNRIAIDLFTENMGNNYNKLTSPTKELVDVFNGVGKIEIPALYDEEYIKLIYRSANEIQNHSIVKQLYDKIILISDPYKDYWKEDVGFNSENNKFYYPPLWLYNIIEMKDYVNDLLKKIKPYVIDETKLKFIRRTASDHNLYEYEQENEIIKLIDKTGHVNHLGRLLGSIHMTKCFKKDVEKRGKKWDGTYHGQFEKYRIARKFIQLPKNNICNAQITIPAGSETGSLMVSGGRNAVNVELLDVRIFSEFIEGLSTSRLTY